MICSSPKIKLAVFGITDPIWNVIKNNLNFYNIEIVSFIDNDKFKQGIRIDGIPVVGMDDFDFNTVNYIIIAALSSYAAIKKVLLNKGVNEEKVMPFFTEQLCQFDVGSIKKYDYTIFSNLYNDSEELYALALEYEKEYTNYCKLRSFEYHGDEWFFKSRLISHACGGKLDNREYMYTNSKEALEYSLNKGFKLIECDITKRNGELIAEHDYLKAYEVSRNCFSVQTFKDILYSIKKYPDVSLLVDVKWRKEEEYLEILNDIEKNIDEVTSSDKTAALILKSQIIMETYNEETIIIAKEKGFECFFTQYRNPEWTNFYKTVNICYKYGVNVVGLPIYRVVNCSSAQLKIFTDKNIHIFSFSTDAINDYTLLRKNGITGVFTNYLTE